MYRISVMYPDGQGATFDLEYYRDTHMMLVKKHFEPLGLIRTEIDKPVSGGADLPAPYICIGHLYFDNAESFDKGIAEFGTTLRSDIPNFTNVTPVRQISEILD